MTVLDKSTEKNVMYLDNKRGGISSATLHILAMLFMLIDHLTRTVFINLEIFNGNSPATVVANNVMSILGRLAFPLFAFMVAEGYYRTHNFRKYALRMLVFALLSEIPYNLMKSNMIFDGYDQNVLWTFLIALMCMRFIDLAKARGVKVLYGSAVVGGCLLGFLFGILGSVDYGGMGVLTVLVFYFFREANIFNRIFQVILLFIMHFIYFGTFSPTFEFGPIIIPLQGFALVSLIFIWLYKGRRGYHSKPFQYLCYAFYPVHMLILYFMTLLM